MTLADHIGFTQCSLLPVRQFLVHTAHVPEHLTHEKISNYYKLTCRRASAIDSAGDSAVLWVGESKQMTRGNTSTEDDLKELEFLRDGLG